MKKRFGAIAFAAFLAAGVTLTGCGSSDNSMGYATESKMVATEAAMYDEAPEAYEENSSIAEGQDVADTSRKLITTMNISSETEDLDATLGQVEAKVKALGGYVESSDIYNGSEYSGRSSSRNASLTVRIPSDKLDSFIETVEGSTNITSKSKNVEDVTLNYVDTESRLNALRTEEKRLLEILNSAETVEDLITVESKLSDVRYEIQSIESRLRTYDNKVNYSTVYISIYEVAKFTPVKNKGAFERISEGFKDSFFSVVDGIAELLIQLAIHIPQIVLFAIVILIIVLIIRKASSSQKKKFDKKTAEAAQIQFDYTEQQDDNLKGQDGQ